MDEADKGRYFELQLDAIATNATIWVNGNVVHRNWSGYTGSNIDISPFLHFGEANTIAIRVDANEMEGWWYEGAGIYRHTWLLKTAPVRVVTDGMHATPRQDLNGRWSIPVAVTVENIDKIGRQVTVDVTVRDPAGKIVAGQRTPLYIPALGKQTASLPIRVGDPQLWSVDNPRLYKVTTRILQANRSVDEVALLTGFRTIRFDGNKGFFLNGTHVKLKGVCIHQDHAGVGGRCRMQFGSTVFVGSKNWASTPSDFRTTRPLPRYSTWWTGWASW